MILHLFHRTEFVYAGAAHESFNEIRLRPRDEEGQRCLRFDLRIEPGAEARFYRDFYGNTVHYFDILAGHSRLAIEAESEVETAPAAARRPVPEVPFARLATDGEREMLSEFATDCHYVKLDGDLRREAQQALRDGRGDVWGDVRRLGAHLHRSFAYRPNSTDANTLASDVLRLRAGVCQDFAHVMLGLCRSSGIPARYVSGYFLLEADRRPGEVEASHAWVEAHIPGFGWAGYDPTHDRPADERYIKVAVGRDYADIRPVSGTYRGSPTSELHVTVRVQQVEPA